MTHILLLAFHLCCDSKLLSNFSRSFYTDLLETFLPAIVEFIQAELAIQRNIEIKTDLMDIYMEVIDLKIDNLYYDPLT